MPIYEYRCPKGHKFEVVQRMTDEPVSKCEVCGEPVERVFSPVAVHYKGSGFYTTDYARKSKGDGESKGKGESASKSESGKSDSSGSGESKGSADKPKASSAKKD